MAGVIPAINGERAAEQIKKSKSVSAQQCGRRALGSRFARIDRRDYRMKQMAMGLDRFPVVYPLGCRRGPKLGKSARKKASLARWWFTAAYDAVRAIPMARSSIQGQGSKLLNEEVLMTEGNRQAWPRPLSGTSSGRLADAAQDGQKIPVADLHNLYDLTQVAGLIKQQTRPIGLPVRRCSTASNTRSTGSIPVRGTRCHHQDSDAGGSAGNSAFVCVRRSHDAA